MVWDAAHYLGISIASLVGTLNIQKIVMTGEMSGFGEIWLKLIEESIRRSGVAPAYYKELAVLYRKTRRHADEVRVLERFAAQKHPAATRLPDAATEELYATQIADEA